MRTTLRWNAGTLSTAGSLCGIPARRDDFNAETGDPVDQSVTGGAQDRQVAQRRLDAIPRARGEGTQVMNLQGCFADIGEATTQIGITALTASIGLLQHALTILCRTLPRRAPISGVALLGLADDAWLLNQADERLDDGVSRLTGAGGEQPLVEARLDQQVSQERGRGHEHVGPLRPYDVVGRYDLLDAAQADDQPIAPHLHSAQDEVANARLGSQLPSELIGSTAAILGQLPARAVASDDPGIRSGRRMNLEDPCDLCRRGEDLWGPVDSGHGALSP